MCIYGKRGRGPDPSGPPSQPSGEDEPSSDVQTCARDPGARECHPGPRTDLVADSWPLLSRAMVQWTFSRAPETGSGRPVPEKSQGRLETISPSCWQPVPRVTSALRYPSLPPGFMRH